MPTQSRIHLSRSIARLIPNILRGAHLDLFAEKSLTHTQLVVLMGLHSCGECTMNKMAQGLHVSMPTASGIIDRLVKNGYVRRVRDHRDRRAVRVSLTRKGELFVRHFQEMIGRRWLEVLELLGEDDVRVFSKIVEKLNQGFERAAS